MSLSLSDYMKQVHGQQVLNGQCWGLAQDYFTKVLGGGTLPTSGGTHDPYVQSTWDAFGSNGLNSKFVKLGPNDTPPVGSLAFWAWGSKTAPLSHVAIYLGDAGQSINTFSQNTNGHQYAEITPLPKEGLLGYMAPKDAVDTGVAPGLTAANGTLAAGTGTGNPILDAILTAFHIQGSTDQIGKVITQAFLPSTWVRWVAGNLGGLLILLGIILIVMDYNHSQDAE